MPASFGTLNKQYVSAIPLLDKLEIMKGIIDVSNEDMFSGFMRRSDRMKPTEGSIDNIQSDAWIYHNYTKGNVMELINTTGATITGSGTATLVVQLASAALSGFVKRNYQVRIGTVTAFVQSVTRALGVATMTIVSPGGNLVLAPGTAITVVGNAYGEGASGGENIRYDLTKNYNYIQTFREHDEFTDVQGKAKIIIPGEELYTIHQHLMKLMGFNQQISMAMFASQITPAGYDSQTGATIVDFEGKPVQMTRGLDQYINSFGILDAVNSNGTLTLADITSWEDSIIANRGPKEYIGWCSTKARRPLASYAKGLTGSNGITSARLSVDGRDIDMMVDSITTPGGFRQELIPMGMLDNPQGLGNVADISGSIYWTPKGNVALEGGDTAPYIRMRYIPQYNISGNGSLSSTGNMQIRETHGGNLAPYPVGDQLMWYTNWTTYQGLECVGVQHMVKQRVV